MKNQSAWWVMSAWQSLVQKLEIAIHGFRKAGIMQAVTSIQSTKTAENI